MNHPEIFCLTATALLTTACTAKSTYSKGAKNRLSATSADGVEGARAALESFYFAFNKRDLQVLDRVWAPDEQNQLNNPLGGIVRGHAGIRALYRRIFEGPARVWVEFYDIVEYVGPQTVVFAGRERGEFRVGDVVVPLDIRTTRVFQRRDGTWFQVHHHGSIDDSEALSMYQDAVREADDAVTVVAAVTVPAANIAAFERATQILVRASRREPGVRMFRLHQSTARPGHYVFFEVFADEGARQEHFRLPHTVDWLRTARELWSAAPQVHLLKAMAR